MPQTKPKAKRETRRSRQLSAWIKFDGDHVGRKCQVMDLSLHGAKVAADVDTDIGSRFSLTLVPHARKGQRCEVIRRRGKMVGIKFVP
jgi:PilZ domain-containing protein